MIDTKTNKMPVDTNTASPAISARFRRTGKTGGMDFVFMPILRHSSFPRTLRRELHAAFSARSRGAGMFPRFAIFPVQSFRGFPVVRHEAFLWFIRNWPANLHRHVGEDACERT